MAIITDGLMLAPADGGDIRDIIAANHAADVRQIWMLIAIMVGVAVLVAAIWFAPRLWHRVKVALAGPPRMPDPLTRPD